MSAATRPRVRAALGIGPWIPGFLLPLAVGLLGVAASALVLQSILLVAGVLLSIVSAVRIRTPAPWLLVALLAVGRLVGDPIAPGAELPALLLVVHLVVVLTLLARVVPARARVQLAGLGPTALRVGLVQLPAQAIALLLLASAGRLQVLPAAGAIGGALLVLVAGLLVLLPRRDQEGPPD